MEETIAKLNANPKKTLQDMKPDDVAAVLEYASDLYYNTSKSLLGDDIYDMAKEYLHKQNPKHPFLKKIGAQITVGDKVELPYWMGSLNKIRDDEKHIEKWKHTYPGQTVISDKLDGISAMLVVKKGVSTLYSRGDGLHGQNISHLLPFITGIPATSHTLEFAVRGELIISKSKWETIKDVGANARNVVAGQVNKKAPDRSIAENIDFVAYELIHPTLIPSLGLGWLSEKGFKVVHNVVVSSISIYTLSEILIDRRAQSPYDIDGIVVYQDDTHRVIKGKNPKYAFAYKSIHTHNTVEVVVTEVQWNVSKDGYIKPTVLFDSVDLAGVKINKATGFNGAYIEKHKLGPGARITIIRSGDVIPHIQNVLTHAANGLPMMPGIPYKWTDTHVDVVAVDAENADAVKSTLEHFVKKLDIQGVGPGIISKFVEAKIDTIPKLLNITLEQLRALPGFQAKSAAKVAAAIKHARDTVTCVDLMAASNILGRGVGSRKIEAIVKAYPGILSRTVPSASEVTQVEGIGNATAKLFCTGLPKFYKMIDDIGIPCRGTGDNHKSPHAPNTPPAPNSPHSPHSPHRPHTPPQRKHDFTNMTIVFSGFRNKDWEKLIESHGGKVTSSVSKNTTLLVVSKLDDVSAKVQKARDLGVKIIQMDAFMQ